MWHCLSPKQPRRSRPVWTGQTAPAGSPNPFCHPPRTRSMLEEMFPAIERGNDREGPDLGIGL
jgi:hypothetical protein